MKKEETIKDLKERIGLMQADNAKMLEEIKHYKSVVSGQKGRLQKLENEVKKWKDYGNEADELNEKRIAEVEEKNKVIYGLQSQVNDMKSKYSEIMSKKEQQIKKLEEHLEYEKLPWWKKFF